MLEGADNSHEFLVIDFVVALRQTVLGQEEGLWVKDAVLAILGQYSHRYVVGGIGLNDDIAVEVEVGQDGCSGKPM